MAKTGRHIRNAESYGLFLTNIDPTIDLKLHAVFKTVMILPYSPGCDVVRVGTGSSGTGPGIARNAASSDAFPPEEGRKRRAHSADVLWLLREDVGATCDLAFHLRRTGLDSTRKARL